MNEEIYYSYSDKTYLPEHYTENILTRPHYSGNGKMNIYQLERLCNKYEEYIHQQHIIKQNAMKMIVDLKKNINKSHKKDINEPPKYIDLAKGRPKTDPNHTCCLILQKDSNNKYSYYRHGGEWDVDIEFRDGKWFTVYEGYDILNNIECIETTKEEWLKCNGEYVTDSDIEDNELTF